MMERAKIGKTGGHISDRGQQRHDVKNIYIILRDAPLIQISSGPSFEKKKETFFHQLSLNPPL